MLPHILELLKPVLVEVILGLIAAYATWFTRNFIKSQESQKNLHKAISTGVDYVTDLLVDSIGAGDARAKALRTQAAHQLVDYTNSSVPGAISHLKTNDEHLTKMATAAINQRLMWLNDQKF